jgi:hypothetical protein
LVVGRGLILLRAWLAVLAVVVTAILMQYILVAQEQQVKGITAAKDIQTIVVLQTAAVVVVLAVLVMMQLFLKAAMVALDSHQQLLVNL